MNINDVEIRVNGKLVVPVKVESYKLAPLHGVTDILREHENGKGFTLTTPSAHRAFDMAEKMAFSGKHYSIKLGKEPGEDWVVVVDEVAE